VEDTQVVVLSAPFHLITEAGEKPVPLTVRVNPVSPALLEFGLMLVIVGAG
jgi:hypothetical protein